MSRPFSTEEIVAHLARGLAPVRPVSPLRRQLLAVAGAWLASAFFAAGWLGLHPLGAMARGPVSTAVLGVLALVGVGGLALGLAGRLPGRERIAIAAAGCCVAGLVVAVAVGVALPGPLAESRAVAEGLDCFSRALLLALPSGLLALRSSRRGAPWRRGVASLGLALGATALGALLVHLSCPSPSEQHWLTAHVVLPLAAGAAASLAVALSFERLDRRSEQPI